MGSTEPVVDVQAIFDAIRAGAGQKAQHYGVKGMKWGVRKDERRAARTAKKEEKAHAKAVKRNDGLEPGTVGSSQKKAGAAVKAKGGSGVKATSEAFKVAESRQVAKRSGVQALSNKELQEAVTRMNLEMQYNKLTAAQKSPGQKFVEQLLLGAGKQQAQTFVNQQASQAVGNYMATGSVTKPKVKAPGPEKRQY